MHKTEIGWTRQDEAGEKLDVFARRVGGEWRFFRRHRRYDSWEADAEPPLADWLELLDGVTRRVNRQLLRPEETDRVRQMILQRFPEADV